MIGAIEEAILTKVATANTAGSFGYTIRTVASYAGDLEQQSATGFSNIPKIPAIAVKTFPAVWVAFERESRPSRLSQHRYRAEAVFSVRVAVGQRRNSAAARLGSEDDVGSYQVLEDVRALITGMVVAGCDPLAPGEVVSLQQDPAFSAYMMLVYIEYDVIATEDTSGEPDNLLLIHVDWDLPPTAGLVPPLPPDVADVDAQDDIVFEPPADTEPEADPDPEPPPPE
jgi:phage gp37-like protein